MRLNLIQVAQLRYKSAAQTILALAPIVLAFYILLTHGANRPYAEEWFDSALIAIAVHDGTLTLGQFMQPVNEAPHLLTKLFVALHTPFTRYDLRLDMLLGLVMSLLTWAGLLWAVWRQDRRLAPWIALPMSALIFTPKQAMNWLVGFQNTYFTINLSIVAILLIVQFAPIGWRTLCLAALIAAISSVALGAAPFFWLPPVIVLWLRGYRHWMYYALWLVLGALLSVRFALSITMPFAPPPPIDKFGLVIHFAIAFLGGPLAPYTHLLLSTAVGILGLALLVVNGILLWRKRPEQLALWAGLAAFSVLAALMVAFGRWITFDGISSTYPMAPRYATSALPFWIALLVMSAKNLILYRRIQPLGRWIYRFNGLAGFGLSAAFVIGLPFAYVPNYTWQGECLRNLPMTRDLECAQHLGAGKSNLLPVLVRADQLAVRQLGVFAQEPPVAVRFGDVAVPLQFIGNGTPSRESPDSRFTTWEINGKSYNVFFQKPPAAQDWTVWFQEITAPTYFEASLYVPPTEQSSEGVTFRIYGQMLFKERILLFEQRFDPSTQREPIPIRVSLEPFLRQVNRLFVMLETEGNGEPAMWIEPRFVLELSEEAARAKYYPLR